MVVAWVRYASWLQDFEPPSECKRLSLCATDQPDIVELRMSSNLAEREIRQGVAASMPRRALLLMVVTPNLFGARRGYVGPTTSIWQ